MQEAQEAELEGYWMAALKEEVGIAITTSNRALLRQHLYRVRADAGNPEYDRIITILPDKEDEIWLVHKDADSSGADNQGYPKLVQP